jgi:hypothetical protein
VPVDVKQFAGPNFQPRAWQPTAPERGWVGSQPPVASSPDLARILELPRRAKLSPGSKESEALIDFVTERYRRPVQGACQCKELGRECITRLNLTQAWGLAEIELRQGLLGPIVVGGGKTFLGILAPLAMPNCESALLLVPSSVLDQLVFDYRLISQHFRVPSLIVHGRDVRVPTNERAWLRVFPYSRLSRPENSEFIKNARPDFIIADECDRLRHPDSATTARVLRYFFAHTGTRFAGWSGSLTDSSVTDYNHLAALALRENSPLPISRQVAEDWARALDPVREGEEPAPAGALSRLCDEGEDLYSGFSRRLLETEGVVSSADAGVSVPLRVRARKAPAIPDIINFHLKKLRSHSVRPDGEEFTDALQISKCACELACGFYYRWKYPRGESEKLIEEWFEARKKWNKAVREKVKQRRPQLDSEDLCAKAAARAWGDLDESSRVVSRFSHYDTTTGQPIYVQQLEGRKDGPKWKCEHWPAWRAIRDAVQPEVEAVWVDDYLAQAAAEWALESPGIVWYGHQAFGKRVAELAELPLHSGGQKAGERIGKERGDRSIVASIKSHGRGRNGLQFFFNRQLVACPPSTATDWEQLLGRTHRRGQVKEVTAEFFAHTPELISHLQTAISRAEYVQATLGSAQKLVKSFR